jgi:hypothetical protein
MVKFADGLCGRSEVKCCQRLKRTALCILGVGRSEGRIVGGEVSIGLDEVLLGAIIVVAVDLIAVVGLEYGEKIVKEVEDFDDGFVGERWQAQFGRLIVFAHGMSFGVDQRTAALRLAVVESGAENTSR